METPEDALITSLIGDTSTPSGVRLLGGGREGEGGRGREREGEGRGGRMGWREGGGEGGREGERYEGYVNNETYMVKVNTHTLNKYHSRT